MLRGRHWPLLQLLGAPAAGPVCGRLLQRECPPVSGGRHPQAGCLCGPRLWLWCGPRSPQAPGFHTWPGQPPVVHTVELSCVRVSGAKCGRQTAGWGRGEGGPAPALGLSLCSSALSRTASEAGTSLTCPSAVLGDCPGPPCDTGRSEGRASACSRRPWLCPVLSGIGWRVGTGLQDEGACAATSSSLSSGWVLRWGRHREEAPPGGVASPSPATLQSCPGLSALSGPVLWSSWGWRVPRDRQ